MFTTVRYEYADLFLKDKADKELMIVSDDGLINITNTELHQQQFELTESLCSENELRFGSCEASMIKFTVNNVFIDMTGKWLTITMFVEGHTDKPFQIGRYKVFSDIATADKTKRDIIAYDAMYDILNADMAAWYNSELPEKDSAMTLQQFHNDFIKYFGLEEILPSGGLVNDNITVQRTIHPEQISGKDIITAICEINGCFGHIGRDGKFCFVYLPQDIMGLYPEDGLYPADDLFPREPKGISVGTNRTYIGQPRYENFMCQTINKVQIRQEENDIGKIYPDTPLTDEDNSYVIENNFLVYGKGSEELLPIAQNILGAITNVIYRPLINVDIKGNPCLEVGDPIRISDKGEIVETYILERTLKGIQALRDAYRSNGVKKYGARVNGMHKAIIQLRGKSNILERTIEETKSTITDIEKGVQTQITQTSEKIEAEVRRASGAEEGLKNDYTAKIKLTTDQLSAEITEKTQAWNTGDHAIDYKGAGEPQIPVEFDKFYLDTKTGAIYAGVSANPSDDWVKVAGYYQYDKEDGIYSGRVLFSEGGEGYGAPKFLKEPLEQYGYVNTDSPPQYYEEGDVWIQTSEYTKDILYFVYSLAHPAEWRIVGYAELETLPEMSSRISQTAKSIELKVSKGDVTSQLLIEPTDIYLKTGRLRIETDNLEINKDGSSGEILSRKLTRDGTKQTARYIKLNTGGIEGGYGSVAKCKIECSDSGLAFRGATMTFCMDSIYVGISMNATKTNKAYTGDIAYVAPQDGDVTKLSAAVIHVWNGLVLDNSSYS